MTSPPKEALEELALRAKLLRGRCQHPNPSTRRLRDETVIDCPDCGMNQ